MPENPQQQNPDWNQSGQPERERDVAEREHDRGRARGSASDEPAPQVSDRCEGRDRPPSNRGRDKKGPWLGGG